MNKLYDFLDNLTMFNCGHDNGSNDSSSEDEESMTSATNPEVLDFYDNTDKNSDTTMDKYYKVAHLHDKFSKYIGQTEDDVIIVRLSLTENPFVYNLTIHNCLIETCSKLVQFTSASSGYVDGTDILLIFSDSNTYIEQCSQEYDNREIVVNTTNVCCSLSGLATITFDKVLNSVLDELSHSYNSEQIQSLLDQNLYFKVIAMKCDEDNLIDYIKYILARTTDDSHYLQQCKYGSVIKYVVDNDIIDDEGNNMIVSYKYVNTHHDIDEILNVNFLTLPFVDTL